MAIVMESRLTYAISESVYRPHLCSYSLMSHIRCATHPQSVCIQTNALYNNNSMHLELSLICTQWHIQWNSSITDTTGTKNFVLYGKVSFAQRVHPPLTILASYAGVRLSTMKSDVLIKDLLVLSP